MSKEMTWEEYADELKAELAKVKKQLAIAVEALGKYADDNEWMDDLGYGYCNKFPEGSDIAQQALQQIKELEK